MVQVIGLYPVLDEGAHQRCQRRDIGVDALAAARTGSAAHGRHRRALRDGRAGRVGELARMVGVDREVARLAAESAAPCAKSGVTRAGIDHRHAGVPAHDLDMRDRGEPLRDLRGCGRGDSMNGSPPVRIDLPDLGPRGDDRRAPRRASPPDSASRAGPDHLAAEAEAAIDRAGMRRASAARGRDSDGRCPRPARMGVVADRVGELLAAA